LKSEEELRHILVDQYKRDNLIIELYNDLDKMKRKIIELEKDITELKEYKKRNPPRLRI
jgi:hypothetical protein